MKRLLIFLVLGLLLIACGANSTPTTAPTDIPTSIPTDTNTPEPTSTSTQLPPTETPTEIPVPSATAVQDVNDPLADYPSEGYGPVGFPENINPLTGLAVENPLILKSTPGCCKNIQ